MKATVLILAKTKMKHASCVGGLLRDGRFVRLLNDDESNQDWDCTYKIGDVYDIEYEDREPLNPPHVEDICLSSWVYKDTLTVDQIIHSINILGRTHFWEGSTELLFDNKLKWTDNGSGYIDEDDIPDSSVGFWIPDKPLTRKDYRGHVRYEYPPITRSTPLGIILGGRGWRNISYVGFKEPVDLIPAGTLCRVSLARWWKPNNQEDFRCHLQLSGWYDNSDGSIYDDGSIV